MKKQDTKSTASSNPSEISYDWAHLKTIEPEGSSDSEEFSWCDFTDQCESSEHRPDQRKRIEQREKDNKPIELFRSVLMKQDPLIKSRGREIRKYLEDASMGNKAPFSSYVAGRLLDLVRAYDARRLGDREAMGKETLERFELSDFGKLVTGNYFRPCPYCMVLCKEFKTWKVHVRRCYRGLATRANYIYPWFVKSKGRPDRKSCFTFCGCPQLYRRPGVANKHMMNCPKGLKLWEVARSMFNFDLREAQGFVCWSPHNSMEIDVPWGKIGEFPKVNFRTRFENRLFLEKAVNLDLSFPEKLNRQRFDEDDRLQLTNQYILSAQAKAARKPGSSQTPVSHRNRDSPDEIVIAHDKGK